MTPKSLILFEGESKSVEEWALDYGITPWNLIRRLEAGMSIADAITTPMTFAKPGWRLPVYRDEQRHREPDPPSSHPLATTYTHNGTTLTLGAWSKLTGIKLGTLRARLSEGWTIERALSTPTMQERNR